MILVTGDVIKDVYIKGTCTRVSPEAPVPVINVGHRFERPGGAANVAAICKGQLLGESNIVKERIMVGSHQVARLDYNDEADPIEPAEFKKAVQGKKVVVFVDYGKGSLIHAAELVHIAKKAGALILVDPKTEFNKFCGADVIKPNFSEYMAYAGTDEIGAVAQEIRNKLMLKALVITQGKHGITLVTNRVKHFPAEIRQVFDVTGAGDTVIAVMAQMLAAGQDIEQAVIMANKVAGNSVEKLGTYQPKTVLCNGCFDIIHPGHIQLLTEAKKHGDHLIVAVDDDESVYKLKGEGRPVNTLEYRMKILNSLEMVDEVIPFNTDRFMELLEALRPDVLVKGSDYKPEDVRGANFIKNIGGELLIVKNIPEFSTTRIIHKIIG